jgi:3-isopropylmalate dehydrogenase
MRARIALLPGDGIGPEVTSAAAAVLQAVGRRFGHVFETAAWPIGGAALRAGQPPLPDATLTASREADAVLLGAVGDPAFDTEPRHRRPESALLALREALGVYANLRPARIWPGLEGVAPLKAERLAGLDLLIVRELTGGLYFGRPRSLDVHAGEACNTMRYSRGEIDRIARVAFAAARNRRRRLMSVDKANVLETSELWRAVVTEIGREFPDVELSHMYVDACAMSLALEPTRFDVILTENLFGDILSDEAGAIVGSLGLLPSASLGKGPGLFEPVHGSAPALAGRDQANPIGAIASAAMLLRHGLRLEAEAAAVEAAIGEAIAAGHRTRDICAPPDAASCTEVTQAIAERVAPPGVV